MPDKVTLELKKGEAVIKEGGNSFIGKVMASANRVKIHQPGVSREVAVVKQHTVEEKPKAKKAKK